jgi:peptide/nickel transport system substrate-binding protein
MSGFYAIPVLNAGEQWIARWNRIQRPSVTALTGYLPETWWHAQDSRHQDSYPQGYNQGANQGSNAPAK